MRLGISTWSLHREISEGRMKVLEFPKYCAELGVEGVEFVEDHLESTDDEYLDEVKHVVVAAGCKVCSISVDNDFSMVDEEERGCNVGHVRKWLGIAHRLGAPVIRVNAGWRSMEDAAVGRVIGCIKELVADAYELGVGMALENHGGLSGNPDAVVRIVEAVGSESFGSCPDFGNLAPDDRYSGLEKLAKYALHVHAKSFEFDERGEETRMDFGRILCFFKQVGYEGYLSIEYEGSGDEREGVRRTVELLKRLL